MPANAHRGPIFDTEFGEGVCRSPAVLTMGDDGSTAPAVAVTLVVRNLGVAGTAATPQSLTFDQPRIVIGRGAHADVRLPSRAVSETHAVVRMEAGELSITDEGSTNGTAVNGQPLVRGRKKLLHPGDRITVPGFEITVETTVAVPDPPERTAAVARQLLAGALAAAGGEAAPPQLHLVSGRRAGQVWKFPPCPARLVAGRGEMCDVILDDADCSRQHAEFVRDNEGVVVRDLGSKNGLFVGGRRVTERRLRDGDKIQLGRTVLEFRDPAEEILRAFEGGADEPATSEPSPSPPAAPAEPELLTDTVKASTPPPPSLPAAGTETPSTPPSTAPRRRAQTRRTADWVVAILAMVVLGVSVVALYFLLRSSPMPPR